MDDFSRWVSPIITILAAACALAASVAVLKQRSQNQEEKQDKLEEATESEIKDLRDELHGLRKCLDESTRALSDTATQMKVIIAEQAVLNRMTTQTLSGITDQLRSHDKELADVKTAIAILREVLKQLDQKLDKLDED